MSPISHAASLQMKIYKGEIDGQIQKVRVKVPVICHLPLGPSSEFSHTVDLCYDTTSRIRYQPSYFIREPFSPLGYHSKHQFICCVPLMATSLGLQVAPSHSRQSGVAPASDSDSEHEDEEQVDGNEIEMKALSHPHLSADPVETDSAEALAFNDPTHVQLTLQVLGLMCDGQNRKLQV